MARHEVIPLIVYRCDKCGKQVRAQPDRGVYCPCVYPKMRRMEVVEQAKVPG